MNFSTIYDNPSHLPQSEEQIFIVGSGPEERSNWWKSLNPNTIREVVEIENLHLKCLINDSPVARLSSRIELEKFLKDILGCVKKVMIDITALPHHVWAPLVRAANNAQYEVEVVYVEPKKYAPPNREIAQSPYDLSEKILGIDPIPGFSYLRDEFETNYRLIAFLGFEGRRFGHILSEVDPDDEFIIPIIGVPGFRPEFVDVAYEGNRFQLENYNCAARIRYAPAFCPFSIFRLLEKIEDEENHALLKIAPIGTKPHALGGLLFSLSGRGKIEFVYDHPVRKPDRSSGIGHCHVYRVSSFLA